MYFYVNIKKLYVVADASSLGFLLVLLFCFYGHSVCEGKEDFSDRKYAISRLLCLSTYIRGFYEVSIYIYLAPYRNT